MWDRLRGDKSVLALSRASLPEAELTAAYIKVLIDSLRGRGFDVHVLVLFQLQRMLARLVVRDEGMYEAATLGLVQAMDTLGMSAAAGAVEVSLGAFWVVSAAERHAARQQHEMYSIMQMTAARMGAGRGIAGVRSRLPAGVNRGGAKTGGGAAVRPGSGGGGGGGGTQTHGA